MRDAFADILKNKADYLRAESGEDFEDRFEQRLRTDGYTKILKRDIDPDDFRKIKTAIVDKKGADFLPFEKYPRSFIRIPFGSQNYPDFIIFTGTHAVPVEIKYSKEKQSKPIWNSGIPRANGIYIFGSYKNKDITFFLGSGILNHPRRLALIDFFEKIKEAEKEFLKSTAGLSDEERRGFMPYIRRAYDQKRIAADDPALRTELNYFHHPHRERLEQEVIEKIQTL